MAATRNQPTAAPTRKVAAASTAAAVTVLLVWIAGMSGIEVPAEAAAALTTLLAAIAGYLTRERSTAPVAVKRDPDDHDPNLRA